jgi:hypothetical protein
MITEDRKFLDLDYVCDQILNQDDRSMFSEAICCYQIGSHRAAVILAWCATADCLERRINDLASEGDEIALEALKKLKPVKHKSIYEENLIAQARECQLFDEDEEKDLRFARGMRSKCAHPTGTVPSAEAVRHILHICSQTVLCREGYRGKSFIKHFMQTKIDDRHLFSNKSHVADTCKYYFDKVPERIRPQFADLFVEQVRNGSVWNNCNPYWKANTIHFFKELMSHSTPDLARKLAQRFQSLEVLDRLLFSVLVGLDPRENVWDKLTRIQAKAYLRDSLSSGKVDDYIFQSYATLCSIVEFEQGDKQLFKERFSPFSEHLSQHTLLQKNRRVELFSIINDAIKDDAFKQQTIKGVIWLVSSELFSQEADELDQFVEELIESDWKEEALRELFTMGSGWSDSLKISFLKYSEKFLVEYSEDSQDDDMLVLFDIANRLLSENPLLLPPQFESTVKRLINGDIKTDWFEEEKVARRNFVRQVDLIRSRHSTYLPVLLDLTLPDLDKLDNSDELDDSYEL